MTLFSALWRIAHPDFAKRLLEADDFAGTSVEQPERTSARLRSAAEKRDKEDILAPDATGFPRRLVKPIEPVPIPYFETYYPTYIGLSREMKLAYVYVRQEILAGTPIADVPLSYLFLCAYEAGARALDPRDFEERLVQIRMAYPEQRKLQEYLARWIADARLARQCFDTDEILDAAPFSTAMRIDIALLSGKEPSVTDILAFLLPFKCAPRIDTAAHALADKGLYALLPIARSSRPRDRVATLFDGYPGNLQRVAAERKVVVPTYLWDGSPATLAMWQLLRDASILVGETLEVPPGVASQLRSSLHPFSRPQTIAELAEVERALWDTEMRLLMALVLSLAELKPYIEGRIAFSRELRDRFDAAATALSMHGGIAPYRRAFHRLICGAAAPWEADIDASAITNMRIGTGSAWFRRGLQHELRGSAPRAVFLASIIDAIARDLQKAPATIADALRSAGDQNVTSV